MAVDEKAFLAGTVFFFHGFKLQVEPFRVRRIKCIGRAFLVDPFSSVQKAGDELFYQHGGRIASVSGAHVIFAAAFEASGNVIIRITEDDNGLVAEFARFLKAVFQKGSAYSPSLKIRVDADRAEGEDDGLSSILIDEPGFCIHHVTHKPSVCSFCHQIQFRDEILMVSQNVGHIMLGAARFVHIPEGPSGQRFHGMLLFLLFGTDGDRWLRLLSIYNFSESR